MPLDHPDSGLNRRWVTTSPVERIVPQANGLVFETKNTVYWPAECDGPNVRCTLESSHEST